MTSLLKCFICDDDRYQKCLKLFLERSSEHQCMRDFIHNTLPDILASVGKGKSQLNVIGVGSGEGSSDLEMLSQLCQKHPGVLVDNEVVEPSSQQLNNYKDIKTLLDTRGVPYQSYELQSHVDITECFTEGDQTGELLLDLLTKVLDFSRTASPELRQGVLRLLRDPQCSVKTGGRVLFNNNLGVIVLDSLS